MKRLTIEEWNDLSEEDQEDMLEFESEAVPEDVLSEQDEEDEDEYEDDEDDTSDEDDDTVVNYKGKKIPLKNLLGEQARLAKKEVEEEIKELREKLESKSNASQKNPDFWRQKADEIARKLVVEDDEGVKTSSEAILELLRLQAGLHSDIMEMQKKREKEIKRATRKIDKEMRDILSDDVIEDLEKIPHDRDITDSDIDRAINYAKGLHADKLVEDAVKNLEREVKRGRRKIKGEHKDDDSYIPAGGRHRSVSGKKPTARQKKLADERGISVESQMLLDEKLQKKRKNKEK